MADLESKLRAWLTTQGYPLEMRVAQSFGKSDAAITQSAYYDDSETGKAREIDVIASFLSLKPKFPEHHWLSLEVVIECKMSPDKPWVCFTGGAWLSNVETESMRPMTEQARTHIREHRTWLADGLFGRVERPAHGLTQALTTGKDIAYEACQSAVKAAFSIVSSMKKQYLTNEHDEVLTVGIPTVVLSGRLFDAHLTAANELELMEVPECIVVWRQPPAGEAGVLINVVTEAALPDFVNRAAATFAKLKQFW